MEEVDVGITLADPMLAVMVGLAPSVSSWEGVFHPSTSDELTKMIEMGMEEMLLRIARASTLFITAAK